MISIFISALLLGFLFNAAPGAVFAKTIKVGVKGGFRPDLAENRSAIYLLCYTENSGKVSESRYPQSSINRANP